MLLSSMSDVTTAALRKACITNPVCQPLTLTVACVAADAAVEYVEPNYIYTALQTDDTYINQLWGMLAAGGGANAAGALQHISGISKNNATFS
jgi:hypothetical protein